MKFLTYQERAQIYDLEYVEYSDQSFLKHYIDKADETLEIPCGTGRNINLYKGKKSYFLDIEYEMIKEIIKKKSNDAEFFFMCADICDFNIKKKFDLIIVPREAFQLLISENLAEQALNNLRLHLKDTGRIIIDIYRFGMPEYNNQAPIYYRYKINENRYIINWAREKGNYSIKRFSSYQLEEGLLKVKYKYEFFESGSTLKYSQIQLKNYNYDDFLKLITRSRLQAESVFGDYNFSQYKEKDNRMIFVIKKSR